MAPRNNVDKLPPEIRDAAYELLRAGKTVDEITTHLKGLGAEVSRSGVGRWRANAEKGMEALKRATALGQSWGKELKENPEGKLGRLLIELAQTNILDNMLLAQEEGEDGEQPKPLDPLQLHRLASAIAKLEAAGTVSLDRELRIRKEVLTKAAGEVDKVAKTRGLTPEAVAEIKSKILGVAA